MRCTMVWVALCGALFAQAGRCPDSCPRDPREIIEKLRIYRLAEALDLTEEQAAAFFPKLRDLRQIDADFHRDRMKLIEKMKRTATESGAGEGLLDLVKEYENLHVQRSQARARKMGEMRKVLTPLQQVKYLIFEDDFEREIRELIDEVRKHRPPPKQRD